MAVFFIPQSMCNREAGNFCSEIVIKWGEEFRMDGRKSVSALNYCLLLFLYCFSRSSVMSSEMYLSLLNLELN